MLNAREHAKTRLAALRNVQRKPGPTTCIVLPEGRELTKLREEDLKNIKHGSKPIGVDLGTTNSEVKTPIGLVSDASGSPILGYKITVSK